MASMSPSVATSAGGELGCSRTNEWNAPEPRYAPTLTSALLREVRRRCRWPRDAQKIADVHVGVVAQAVVLGVDDIVRRQALELIARRLDRREVERRVAACEVVRFASFSIRQTPD